MTSGVKSGASSDVGLAESPPGKEAGGAAQRLIVLGASSGAFEALRELLQALPADFATPMLAVVHIGAHDSMLPELLQRASPLPVQYASDGEDLRGVSGLLLAPPDRHLLVRPGHLHLSRGPKENFARPAVDPLFRSAALAYGARVTGIILSGGLDDGTVGLQAIKAYGGMAVVQDPASARASSMPASALAHVEVDHVLAPADIARLLMEQQAQSEAARSPALLAALADTPLCIESQLEVTRATSIKDLGAVGRPSTLTCPECGGTLWEIGAAGPLRFRCHVGHSFTAQSLAYAQQQFTEEAIWAAVRALHEKENLMRRFAQKSTDQRQAGEYQAAADHAAGHASVLRKMVSERANDDEGMQAGGERPAA